MSFWDFFRSSGYVSVRLRRHFRLPMLDELVTTTRKFPATIRVDLQYAIDKFLTGELKARSYGTRSAYDHMGASFMNHTLEGDYGGRLAPIQYDEIDVGEKEPVRCINNAIWFSPQDGARFAVVVAQSEMYCPQPHVHVELAVLPEDAESEFVRGFFRRIEQLIAEAGTFRGKIISLEVENDYSGASGGIKVHRLPGVLRNQVILPAKTLDLLDRNVTSFIRHRESLRGMGLPVKKGLLFYGPPGTGKTHTIRYLASALEDHTTLLITAEQVGLLADYFKLARFMQPSIVVIEDVDLIARSRDLQTGPCSESLLNKLLNEMDGLRQDAEVLFILTTNRPDQLEEALASRPGRIDQAIEFPLPDDTGRNKLIQLYSGQLKISEETTERLVAKTEKSSAAFIKELMRRSAQNLLEDGKNGELTLDHAHTALDEMLFAGGSLNRKLLGGASDECGFHSAAEN